MFFFTQNFLDLSQILVLFRSRPSASNLRVRFLSVVLLMFAETCHQRRAKVTKAYNSGKCQGEHRKAESTHVTELLHPQTWLQFSAGVISEEWSLELIFPFQDVYGKYKVHL